MTSKAAPGKFESKALFYEDATILWRCALPRLG
jgi:hypothetical protein